ncbi:MAG: SRPBCC family protein [Myxococcales bacterium]|nr:MAG: SRPBCC family protein [Myxococcales bacterium]
MTWPARHISRFIPRKPAEVSAFLADYRNLPEWAQGLSTGVREEGEELISDSPLGRVRVRFGAGAELGIFDHDVTLPDGRTFHNPLRVLRNDEGSEVVFTLYRVAGVTDEDYEKDAAMIAADLERLSAAL